MSPLRAAAIAGLVGFAVMSVELTAVRLLAPHFGDSAYVWTNVIGAILVALAIGAFCGGRVADGTGRRLALVLIVGGTLVAIGPWIAGSIGAWLLPEDLALDAAMGALVSGSLTATLVLFVPPVLLAGMATPMLVAALAEDGGVGRASGHVAAWSTIGSLVGTFATTHWLVPGIGSRLTLTVCAIALIAAGSLAGSTRAGLVTGALVALAGVAGPAGIGTLELTGDRRVIAQVESAIQYLAVIEREEGGRRLVQLQINEGLDSFHSVAIDGTPWTGGRYYDYFAAVPYLRGDGTLPARFHVMSLGAASGTFERLLTHVCPAATFDSVELDPAVVELAKEHFGGYPQGVTVFAGIDGRVFAERSRDAYDAVLVDAYERQIYIPAQLASREFFEAVKARLAPGGIVAVNAGGRTFEDPVVAVVGRTMATVFGSATAFRVPRSRNFMLLARPGRDLDYTGLGTVARGVTDPRLREVLEAASKAHAWRTFAPGEPVLTDDRPFLDSVQDAALRRSFEPALMEMAGTDDPDAATQAVYAALRAGDIDGAGVALRRAAKATGALRFYAGDYKWSSHDLPGALAEYEAARVAGVEAALEAPLQQRIADARRDVQKLDRARAIAARNAWLGGSGLVLLLVAGLAALRR